MCDRICKTCGGDDAVAKIAEKMGFRPDIAFVRIKKLEPELAMATRIELERCLALIDDFKKLHEDRYGRNIIIQVADAIRAKTEEGEDNAIL